MTEDTAPPRAGAPVSRIPSLPMWDAVVVGAGPAGSMTAFELSRMGRRVLLLDRQGFPRPKVCGGTLSPGVQDLLAEAGLDRLLPESGARRLHTLRLGGRSARMDLPLRGSTALSRRVLDSALVDAAVKRGAHFCPQAKAELVALESDRRVLEVATGGERWEVSTRAVVAADGVGSGILARAGAPSQPPPRRRRRLVGLGGLFPPDVPRFEAGVIHMALGKEGYVGLVRVEDGSLNVAAAVNPDALRESDSPTAVVNTLLSEGGWPSLPPVPDPGWKGTPELTRHPARLGGERLFAVGDAAGYVEPFTGEGVLWGLAGARWLAPIVAEVDAVWRPRLLEDWEIAHRERVRQAQRICRAAGWVIARPLLASSLLRVLSGLPILAEPVLRRVGAPLPSPT